MNNIAVLSHRSHLHFFKEQQCFPPQNQWEDKIKLRLSSWRPFPPNSTTEAAVRGAFTRGGHQLMATPLHSVFIPSHVLWCVSCLQGCWLKGLGPFLRCSCRGVGSWWDFHANKACPEHLGRVSDESTAQVGASSFWTKALSSRVVVFLSGFARHSHCYPVLCCTYFRQPLLSSANAERLRGFFGFF